MWYPMVCGSCLCKTVRLEAMRTEPQIKKLKIFCTGCANITYIQLNNPSMTAVPDQANEDGGYHCVWDHE